MPKVKTAKPRKRFSDASIHQCGKFYRHLSCTKEAEHKFFKRIYCGYAGCPVCRKGDWTGGQVSEAVRRRVMNTWDKVMYGRALIAFVLTFPEPLQERFLFKQDYTELFKLAGEFAQLATGIGGSVVCLHPVGNTQKHFSPHFEVLVPVEDDEWNAIQDPKSGILPMPFVAGLSDLWTWFLAQKYPEIIKKLGCNVQANVLPLKKPGPMVKRVRYAADFHWASDYEGWSQEAKNFMMSLRGTRTIRGFGFLSDRKWKKHVEARVPVWQFYLTNSKLDEFGEIIDDGSKCFLCDGRLRAIRYLVDGKLLWSIPESSIQWTQWIAIGQGLFCDLLLGLKHLKKRISNEMLLEEFIDDLAMT